MDYDLIVVGGGTAGMNAMKAAHALGGKIAIVEGEASRGHEASRGPGLAIRHFTSDAPSV